MAKNLLILLLCLLCGALALLLVQRSSLEGGLAATTILPARRGDLRLMISESYLERRMRVSAAQALREYRIQELRVDIQPGNRVVLRGTTDVLGAPVPLTIELRLDEAGGTISAPVQSGRVGPLPLPPAQIAEIQRIVDQTLTEVVAVDRLGLAIAGLESEEGSVTLVLTERPGR